MELIGAGKGFEFYVEEHIWLIHFTVPEQQHKETFCQLMALEPDFFYCSLTIIMWLNWNSAENIRTDRSATI